MRQYVLPKYFKGEDILKLNKEDSNYFLKVLRLKINDKILARDMDGNSYQLVIKKSDKNHCICSVIKLNKEDTYETIDDLPSQKKDYPIIHLFQCVCKGKKNEAIIRMATEMGVSSISLVQSKYCIAKKENSNNQRYEKIIKEAIQQSGSSIMTKFDGVIDFKDFIKGINYPLFFFHQQSLDNRNLIKKLENLDSKAEVGILIGPEGGLSENECKILIEKNFTPVTLKTNILRAETASIVAISAIHTLLMEK